MAVLDPGDEVVIPAPYWVSYPDMALLADGTAGHAVLPGPSRATRSRRAQLEAAITPKTRLLLLNSPCNPTGAAYTRAELRRARRRAAQAPARAHRHRRHVRAHLLGAASRSAASSPPCPDLYDRTVTINGVSKSYAMTGWRIGYCGGPAEIIDGDGDDPEPEHVEPVVDRAEGGGRRAERRPGLRRRDEPALQGAARLLHRRPERAAGLQGAAGGGHVLRLVRRIGGHRSRGLADDNAFAELLLDKAGVAGVPGSGFGAPGHIRFSFAVSMQTLEKALERMGKALRQEREVPAPVP